MAKRLTVRDPAGEAVQSGVTELALAPPRRRKRWFEMSWSIIPATMACMVTTFVLWTIQGELLAAHGVNAWGLFPYMGVSLTLVAVHVWASLQVRLAVRRSMEVPVEDVFLGWRGFTIEPSPVVAKTFVFERTAVGLLLVTEVVVLLVAIILMGGGDLGLGAPFLMGASLCGIGAAVMLPFCIPIMLPGGRRWVRPSAVTEEP